ncbi:hypothetical protein GCM10009660_56970 [Catellatospora bangladeshensis]
MVVGRVVGGGSTGGGGGGSSVVTAAVGGGAVVVGRTEIDTTAGTDLGVAEVVVAGGGAGVGGDACGSPHPPSSSPRPTLAALSATGARDAFRAITGSRVGLAVGAAQSRPARHPPGVSGEPPREPPGPLPVPGPPLAPGPLDVRRTAARPLDRGLPAGLHAHPSARRPARREPRRPPVGEATARRGAAAHPPSPVTAGPRR